MRSILITAVIFLLSACASTSTYPLLQEQADPQPDSVETANEAMARQLVTSLGKVEFNEIAQEMNSPQHIRLRSEFEHLLYNTKDSELEGAMVADYLAIPNRHNDIDILVADGNMVMLRYRITGTHSGNLYGIDKTDMPFKIPSVAILKFSKGKLVESWFMADEVGLLRQIGQQMPKRADGQSILPPVRGENARRANDILPEMLANPQAGQEFQNMLKVLTRRTSPRPAGRPFKEILRGGHFHIIDAGKLYGDPSLVFAGAFSGRHDKIEYILSNENWVAIKFRLTATNTGSMFGLPATNGAMDNWETSFAKFEDGEWTTSWFFGDDMGMLYQLNGTQDYFVPTPCVTQPTAITK